MKLEEWAKEAALSEARAIGLKFPPGSTLSQAMRHWVHAMFGPQQLVVIDADDPALKATFGSVMQREVRESLTHDAVLTCNGDLESAGIQAAGARPPMQLVSFDLRWASSVDRF